ncbi:MAG: TusE/DsrC/DsvC family sulfur relay protein [Myxococcales bacterium]|nr:TusE/DsrC/DsvC family sulfur relay protein [Myxococcales bacterium]
MTTHQSTDLVAALTLLTKEVQTLRTEVGELRRTQRKGAELMDELGPIGKEVMDGAMESLGALEQKGYFNFGKELVGVLDHIVAGYTAEDVKDLGENVVTILDTVRAVTQPGMLVFAQQAGEAIEAGDQQGPVGMWDMVKASKDQDVQHGMAVMLSIVRQIGRTARGQRPSGRAAPKHPKYAAMAGRLASNRPRRAQRPRPAQRSVNAPKPAPVAVNVAAATAAPLPAPFDALKTDGNGHLWDPNDWSVEYAQAAATQAGVGPLTDEHFVVLDYARTAFAEAKKSPNVRALANGSGVGTKGIYKLFPKKPGPTIAKLAGIPKPVGCI